MKARRELLRDKLRHHTQLWIDQGLPPRGELEKTADDLTAWKLKHQVNAIWPQQPLMLISTLDDGIGQGIEIIAQYATVTGIKVTPLGLLQSPRAIVEACHRCRPAFLGLTVLQLDSEEDLCFVGRNLSPHTCLIAGGPTFKHDPEMAQRCGVGYVASNVAYFVDFLLNWSVQ